MKGLFVNEVKKPVRASPTIASLEFRGLDGYALHLAINEGLDWLVVHMDNGWNSELAQNNIVTLSVDSVLICIPCNRLGRISCDDASIL